MSSSVPSPAARPAGGKSKTFSVACAVLVGGHHGPVLACDPGFAKAEKPVPIGFSLEFPLGAKQAKNEDNGFGVRHSVTLKTPNNPVSQVDFHRISVAFPRGKYEMSFKDVDAAMLARVPGANTNSICALSIRLQGDAQVDVAGYGMPFANGDFKVLEEIVNDKVALVKSGMTLFNFLHQREFHLLVSRRRSVVEKEFAEALLPPPFSYPYGTKHVWDAPWFWKIQEETRSMVPFRPAYSYHDDNAHLAVMTQAVTQDVMWLNQAAAKIAEEQFWVYFVPLHPTAGEHGDDFYVIVLLTTAFRVQYDAAWRRLVKNPGLQLWLFESSWQDDPSAKWDAKTVDNPRSVDLLSDHPTEKHELVLQVRRPTGPGAPKRGGDFKIKTFPSRSEALRALKAEGSNLCSGALRFDASLNETKRQVNAVNLFHPDAHPSNPVALGLPANDDPEYSADKELVTAVKDKMALHRALVRGRGFYHWMSSALPPADLVGSVVAVSLDPPSRPRPLPLVNFLDVRDEKLADALVHEALPDDRDRFRAYLSRRPLGLGILTAGPGFGKTTAISAATLAMNASLGQILGSGPSNVAVDNFAERLDRVTRSVCSRYNKDKGLDDQTRQRHALVVRGYNPREETNAAARMLKDPEGLTATDSELAVGSWWRPHLSLALWALAVLRSPAKGVRQLDPDDKPGLLALQAAIDADHKWGDLRALIAGQTGWDAYEGKNELNGQLRFLFVKLLSLADILCVTPTGSENGKDYREWKNREAKGIAVDEAANTNRADLYCVWGNTLLPCFLAGDPKQLPPAVLSAGVKDADGNLFHRHVQDAKISALVFFQASGVPTYHLRV